MAEKIEKVTIRICDLCGGRENLMLYKCPVCGKDCCFSCIHDAYDVWHTNICKGCLKNEDINAYYMSAHKNWGIERIKVLKEMDTFKSRYLGKEDGK